MKMTRMDVKNSGNLFNIPEPLVGPTIMVVDEDLGLICRLGKILGEAGYQVVPALNSRQAASLIEKLRITPDLVIANLSLMKITGMNYKKRHDVSAELGVLDSRRRSETGRFSDATRAHSRMAQGQASHGA
jgi:DNA-binding NtrC family response regulator